MWKKGEGKLTRWALGFQGEAGEKAAFAVVVARGWGFEVQDGALVEVGRGFFVREGEGEFIGFGGWDWGVRGRG